MKKNLNPNGEKYYPNMSLYELRQAFRSDGYKASYAEYKGVYSTVKQAVYVWDDGMEKAAEIALNLGFDVKKDGKNKRYMIS